MPGIGPWEREELKCQTAKGRRSSVGAGRSCRTPGLERQMEEVVLLPGVSDHRGIGGCVGAKTQRTAARAGE